MTQARRTRAIYQRGKTCGSVSCSMDRKNNNIFYHNSHSGKYNQVKHNWPHLTGARRRKKTSQVYWRSKTVWPLTRLLIDRDVNPGLKCFTSSIICTVCYRESMKLRTVEYLFEIQTVMKF